MGERVLIVDDHATFRTFARRLLAASGFEVVGEAVDGASALNACAQLHPRVVLLDIGLPDLDGFAVAQALSRSVDPPEIVLVSSRSRADYGGRADDPAVRGFIRKDKLTAAAVRAVLQDHEPCGR
jgi:DNA-binding NarL/FixJ family response regulator